MATSNNKTSAVAKTAMEDSLGLNFDIATLIYQSSKTAGIRKQDEEVMKAVDESVAAFDVIEVEGGKGDDDTKYVANPRDMIKRQTVSFHHQAPALDVISGDSVLPTLQGLHDKYDFLPIHCDPALTFMVSKKKALARRFGVLFDNTGSNSVFHIFISVGTGSLALQCVSLALGEIQIDGVSGKSDGDAVQLIIDQHDKAGSNNMVSTALCSSFLFIQDISLTQIVFIRTFVGFVQSSLAATKIISSCLTMVNVCYLATSNLMDGESPVTFSLALLQPRSRT